MHRPRPPRADGPAAVSSHICPGGLAGPAKLPTESGGFEVWAFTCPMCPGEHAVLTLGDARGDDVLVRVHSGCVTGDVFHSLRCDCGPQLHAAMRRIQREGRGAVVWLNQEGRGIGFVNKVRAYVLQDAGADTVEANRALGLPDDGRSYEAAACVLRRLGVASVRLLTNNPAKVAGLSSVGVPARRVPLVVEPNDTNRDYLAAKRTRLGHVL